MSARGCKRAVGRVHPLVSGGQRTGRGVHPLVSSSQRAVGESYPLVSGRQRTGRGVYPLVSSCQRAVGGSYPLVSAANGRVERSQAGFTLVELLISLLLMSLALALAAQVMMEGAQMLTDAAAEQADAPMPLVAARLRGDIRAAARFEVLEGLEGPALFLEGHPAGLVVYQKVGDELRRTVVDGTGKVRGEGPALYGVTSWRCAPMSRGLVAVSLSHRRSAIRRGLLPSLPGNRGPRSEERSETFWAAPRGAGLGFSW